MRLRIVECSQDHLDRCAEHRLLGAAAEPFTDWKAGDLVAFAVDGALAALAKVRGLPYEEKRRLWPDDVYPYRIPVEFRRRLAPERRLPLAGALRRALAESWGVQDDAGLAAGIQARRLINGAQAERIVSAIEMDGKDESMNREEPPAAAAETPGTIPQDAAGSQPARALVLRNCLYGSDCGQAWDGLVKTELATVRFCTRCERAVYHCADGEALMDSLRKGRCVAIGQ
jgi:hypothetical protein